MGIGCLGVALALIVSGCGKGLATRPSTDGGGVPSPDVAYPIYHDSPSWSSNGLIGYRDNGVICTDSTNGTYLTEVAIQGVWFLDPTTRRTKKLLVGAYDPCWAPNGTEIAFETAYQIFVTDSSGGDIKQLTSEARNLHPSWSPDGQLIAYEHQEGMGVGCDLGNAGGWHRKAPGN